MSNKRVTEEKQSLFSFIIDEFGGPALFLSLVQPLISNVRDKTKGTINNILRLIEFLILPGIFMFKIIDIISKRKNEKLSVRQKIANILKVSENDTYNETLDISDEILDWLFTTKTTNIINIIETFNENLEPCKDKSKISVLLITFESKRFIIYTNKNENKFIVKHIYYSDMYNLIDEIKNIINNEYLSNFNMKDKIFIYNGFTTNVKNKTKIPFKVDHYDVKSLAAEIRTHIDHNIKRAYLLGGSHGNGKSLIITKLTEYLDDIPFISITKGENSLLDIIPSLFRFTETLKKVIVIVEDIDCYSLKDKSDTSFQSFLEGLDGLKSSGKVVILATLNEPIHEAIMNRRGRFDKVIFVGPPTDIKQIEKVFINHYFKLSNKNIKVNISNKLLINKLLKLNRADLCEIVNFIYINKLAINEKNIAKGYEHLLETINSINKISDN